MPKKPRHKIFACEKGHKILSDIKNEKRLLAGKMVCGVCGKNFTPYNPASWNTDKHFLCGNGHVVTIAPFTNGMCNFSWGNQDGEWINMQYAPEELSELLSKGEVMCPVGNTCKQKLFAIEDCVLLTPKISTAKLKTRVGDVWDKYGCPQPKDGRYDKNYNFRETDFHKVNKERVKGLREKRNTRPAGEIVHSPTERNYRGGGAARPKKEDL